jgi:hypothetical protein
VLGNNGLQGTIPSTLWSLTSLTMLCVPLRTSFLLPSGLAAIRL